MEIGNAEIRRNEHAGIFTWLCACVKCVRRRLSPGKPRRFARHAFIRAAYAKSQVFRETATRHRRRQRLPRGSQRSPEASVVVDDGNYNTACAPTCSLPMCLYSRANPRGSVPLFSMNATSWKFLFACRNSRVAEFTGANCIYYHVSSK